MVARLVRIEKVRGSIPLSSTKLVVVRTSPSGALTDGLPLVSAPEAFVGAFTGVSWSVPGWGIRNTGTMVSGPVIFILAMSVSMIALRVWSLPEAMMVAMWSAMSVRVAGEGGVGALSMVARSSSRRVVSCRLESRSSVSRELTSSGSMVPFSNAVR